MIGLDANFFTGAFVSYFIAACFYIVNLIFSKKVYGQLGTIATILGICLNALVIVMRISETKTLAFANIYEFGIAFTLGLVTIYFCIEKRYSTKTFGAFVMPIVFILSGVISSFYQEAKPLVSVLQSNWLLAHVLTAVFAYGAFAIAFAVAIMYYWKDEMEKTDSSKKLIAKFPSLSTLDDIMNKSIILGLPFLTLTIITGSIWAEYTWGSYWQGDPKEIWSLVTWLVYSIYLHGRVVYKWQGIKTARWSILGFSLVIFTFIFVNLFLTELHKY